ncbi:hypothetical protein AB0D94_32495 [Streptomyces sp. NPDC048255]|uniref:hypothetical protein n=1 Tax=Streptomyces sp. NPDC048255 TaxID=3154713 RepID=UPI0033CD228E
MEHPLSVDSAGGVGPNGLIGVADLNAAIGDTDAPDEMRDCARLLARFDYEHFSVVQTEQGAQDNRQANRDDLAGISGTRRRPAWGRLTRWGVRSSDPEQGGRMDRVELADAVLALSWRSDHQRRDAAG